MSWYKLLFVFLLFSSCKENVENSSTEQQNEEEYITLRVLTYNIYHGETNRRDGVIDLERYGQIIKDQSADLVALQEVDKETTRVAGIDLTEELSNRTGLDGYFCKFQNYRGGEYGAAILSKFPVVELDVKQAYVGSEGTERTLPFAKVELKEDTYIYFCVAHLSLDQYERKVQIEQIVNHYEKELNKAPLLICGDFNTESDSEEMKVLLEEFSMVDTARTYTFSARTGLTKKIDFIFYPANEDWEVVDFKRICRADASDHCALFAELKLRVNK